MSEQPNEDQTKAVLQAVADSVWKIGRELVENTRSKEWFDMQLVELTSRLHEELDGKPFNVGANLLIENPRLAQVFYRIRELRAAATAKEEKE